ncbi:hypothetical protein DPSP01_014164 [Paraphaeosphaeria sporulosa]
MASHAPDRKPDKLIFHWVEGLIDAAFQILFIFTGRGTVISFLCLFWDLTAVLWAPQNWIYWLQWTAMATSGGVYIDVDALVANPSPPCLSYAEKKTQVEADASDVSGWYGPGAYLAWLFTVYVSAFSSIWHADGIDKSTDVVAEDDAPGQELLNDDAIDGEFLAALTYPAIAILDILYRFSRCRVDPTLDAALLVVLTAILTLSTARRLASPPDMDKWVAGDIFPTGPRQWILSVFLVVGHSLVFSITGEPYFSWRLVLTVYLLALANVVHSTIKIERLMDRHPYRIDEKRPRWERIAVFMVFQIVFMVVLGVTQKSVFPRTGASLSDMDQCATLITVIVATIFARRAKVLDWVNSVRLRLAGFRPVQTDMP